MHFNWCTVVFCLTTVFYTESKHNCVLHRVQTQLCFIQTQLCFTQSPNTTVFHTESKHNCVLHRVQTQLCFTQLSDRNATNKWNGMEFSLVYLASWLQSVLNAAARLVFSARRSERITPFCFVNSIGWEFRSESHSGCAFWPTAVSMEQRWRTLLQGPSLDIWRRYSTSCAFCWLSHAGGTVYQTFNTRWPCFPSGYIYIGGTCVEQLVVVC